MRRVYFTSVPYVPEDVTLALESGASGLIVPAESVPAASSLARCDIFSADDAVFVSLAGPEDEQKALAAMAGPGLVILNRGWEIIPVENLLAHAQKNRLAATLALEVTGPEEGRVMADLGAERGRLRRPLKASEAACAIGRRQETLAASPPRQPVFGNPVVFLLFQRCIAGDLDCRYR